MYGLYIIVLFCVGKKQKQKRNFFLFTQMVHYILS